MGRPIDIGQTPAGAPAAIDLEELLATRLLVQGNSGSGKSHLLRRLLEQSAGLVQQVVIDPEGDFCSLGEKYGHLVLDAAENFDDLAAIGARVRAHRVSVVLNLENCEVDAQLRAAAQFLSALFEADRDLWFPALVVVDEAQLFAPAAASDGSDEARRMSLAAMTNLMCRGRKRGLAGVIATQRLAKLAKNVAAEASNFLMGRTFLDIDMSRAADLLGMERRQAEIFRDLERGVFVGLGPAIARRPLRTKVGAVETGDRGGAPKLSPLPEALDEGALQDLIFGGEQAPAPPLALPPRPERLQQIFAAIETPPQNIVAAPPPELSAQEREATLDDIVAELAAQGGGQAAETLYRDFQTRCRIRRLGPKIPDVHEFRRRLIFFRAAEIFPDLLDAEAWTRAEKFSEQLPIDLQPVYLLVARAAAAQKTCPDDMEIARFFGSHSPGRARRLLGQLEQADIFVAREQAGARVIALPELGIETASSASDDAA